MKEDLEDLKESLDEVNIALKKKRMEMLSVQVKNLSESMKENREQQWKAWNKAFFLCFSKSFQRFKNALVVLKLSEEQLSSLQKELEVCLSELSHALEELRWQEVYENTEEVE